MILNRPFMLQYIVYFDEQIHFFEYEKKTTNYTYIYCMYCVHAIPSYALFNSIQFLVVFLFSIKRTDSTLNANSKHNTKSIMCEYFLTQYVDNFLKNSIWTTQICTTNICMHQHHVLFVFVIFVLKCTILRRPHSENSISFHSFLFVGFVPICLFHFEALKWIYLPSTIYIHIDIHEYWLELEYSIFILWFRMYVSKYTKRKANRHALLNNLRFWFRLPIDNLQI